MMKQVRSWVTSSHSRLDQTLTFCVQVTRCFIEDENFGVADDRARNAYSLAFAA